MTVINRQKDGFLPSTISVTGLAHAFAQLDVKSIPPEKRAEAMRMRMLEVMGDSLEDPAQRAVCRAALILAGTRGLTDG